MPIFLIVLVDVLGFTLVIPLLSIYAETFHATALSATLLVSVYAACQLISGPVLGRVSDRIGRKSMLIVSQVGTFIGFIVLARASALWMIYVARIIDGATAGNISLAQAYISDNSAPKDRARSFARIGVAFGLGFFVGPSATAWLVQYGMTVPIYAAAGLSLTSVVGTTLLIPGGRPPALDEGRQTKQTSGYFQLLTRPVLRGLFAQFFCFIVSFSTFTSGFALFAERRFSWGRQPFGPREIGWCLGYVGLLGIAMQGFLVGRLVRRFGESKLARAGFVSLVVGYAGLGVARHIGDLVLAVTLLSFGNGVVRPALNSLVSQSAGRHEQGAVLGVNQSMQAMGQVLAPGLAGLLIERGLLSHWAWAAALVALLGMIAAHWGSDVARTALSAREKKPVDRAMT